MSQFIHVADTGTWVAEVSEYEKEKQPVCPECGNSLNNASFHVATNEEAEITHWTHKCRCGCEIKIYND